MTRPQGINFQILPQTPPETLARMDVAAFVGFAASGPVDIPVPMEDPVHFKELFGEDQELAWDSQWGQVLSSYLGPAVRAFFRNGGRRCWVVRVADHPVPNYFPLPGLMQTSLAGNYQGVQLQARSPGSWSDGLRVGTVLQSATVGDVTFDGDFSESRLLRVTQAARTPIRAGDLLRIPCQGRLLYFAVDDASEVTDTVGHKRAPTTEWRLRGRAHWFRTGEAPVAQPKDVPVRFRRLAPPGDTEPAAIWSDGKWTAKSPSEGPSSLSTKSAQAPLRIGDLICVEDRDTKSITLLAATEVETDVMLGQQKNYITTVSGWAPLTIEDPPPFDSSLPAAPGGAVAERLSLTLWVEDALGRTHDLSGLGFMPSHPRFLGHLPDDAKLFRPEDERSPRSDGRQDHKELYDEVAYPRFPLAATDSAADQLILPIGMDSILWKEIAGTALPNPTPRLERDGLKEFKPELFLDPDLQQIPAETLLARAFTKRHVEMATLQGVHALLPLDEVTLLCIPDLAQAGWTTPSVPDTPPVTAPALKRDEGSSPGELRLTWETVAKAHGYTVQSAADSGFTHGVQPHTVTHPDTFLRVDEPPGITRQVRYFRVRADSPAGPGPWSTTVSIQSPRLTFHPRDRLATPELVDSESQANVHTLTWDCAKHATCLLQTAADPDFANPTTYYEGPGQQCAVWRSAQTWAYYRVRTCRNGETSPWSNTVAVPPINADAGQHHASPTAAAPKDRLEIHRALLRLCLARGDLFAILSLPADHREESAIHHVRSLASLMGAAEAQALSYGALYYPWLHVETAPGETQIIPPDGPVMGMIAGLSFTKGAWLPPANKPLARVPGLHHTTPRQTYARLLEEGVNMIVQPPDGVLVRSAHTLSLDDNLRPINVRRLLMLIRRLVRREGHYLLFEPNSEAFRRGAERRFERMLTDLFVQGAFAGATPAESFRVRLDPAYNTLADQEEGRLAIDVSVAPMHPLVFMTVRVVQAEGREPSFTEGSA